MGNVCSYMYHTRSHWHQPCHCRHCLHPSQTSLHIIGFYHSTDMAARSQYRSYCGHSVIAYRSNLSTYKCPNTIHLNIQSICFCHTCSGNKHPRQIVHICNIFDMYKWGMFDIHMPQVTGMNHTTRSTIHLETIKRKEKKAKL